MKALIPTTLLALSIAFPIGCATSPRPQSVAADPSVLRVGVTPNAPPMIFKQDGQVVGVEADLAGALGRELGRRVVFVELKWENLIDALVENKVDILMSSLTITPARQYRIAFTAPYLKVGQMALVRSEDKYRFLVNLAESAGRGIAVERATTADHLLRQEYPRAKLKYYPSGEAAVAALIRRNVDLFVSDSPMIMYLGGLYEARGLTVAPMLLTEESLGWGVRSTDDRLRAAANAFLKKAQENGQLTGILRRWMPGYH